ncbi:MAG: hypothetical protein FWC41_00070 [Firmicutes bacterium]|nr:hypothetical protein [Bacillota bacterium]
MQNIAYAHYSDAWVDFDTHIGDLDIGLYGKTTEEILESENGFTDEMYEKMNEYIIEVDKTFK